MKNSRLFIFILFSLFSTQAFGSEIQILDLFLEEPRKKLEERGVSFDAVYAGDIVSHLAGGLHHKTTYLGRLDFGLTVDLDKAGLIPGGKIYVSAQNTHGGENPTERYIGDLQTVDNIEAPDSMRLYEWWYEQHFFHDRLAILAGVHGLDCDFAVTEYGGLFLNSSFGTPSDLSANVPVSIFPLLGPAARVRFTPNEKFEFLAAIFDGDPTDDGKNRHNVNYRLASHQGIMMIAEAAYHPTIDFHATDVYQRCIRLISRTSKEHKIGTKELLPSTIKFGSWLHTKDTSDALATNEIGESIVHKNNYGFYGLVDQMIFREKEGEDQGLGIFVQLGGVPDSRNVVDFYLGSGLNYKGLISERDHDTFGIAAASAFISESLRKSRDNEIDTFNPATGNLPAELESNESTLEVTYRIHLNDHLAIQPDYQIVFNPAAEENRKTAHVFLLRFNVSF